MKVIDFEKKGNVIRLYLGEDNCNDYWGDDWDDCPYEHNAGTVYEEYISGYADFALPFDCAVIEAADDWNWSGNTPYCKDDMKDRIVPCLLIVPKEICKNYWGDPEFSKLQGSDNEIVKIYFNDTIEEVIKNINNIMKLSNIEFIQKIVELHYDKEKRTLFDTEGSEFHIY